MSDENDSWLEGIGVNVTGIVGSIQDAATSVVDAAGSVASSAASSVAGVPGGVYDATASAASSAYGAASSAVAEVYGAVTSPSAPVATNDAPNPAVQDLSSKASASAAGSGAGEQLSDWKKCMQDCEEKFQQCLKSGKNAQECLAARNVCLRNCPPEPPPPPKKVCTAAHPTELHTSGYVKYKEAYGFTAYHNWKSTSRDLADLKDCKISELITYSAIPNPPYGVPGGSPVAESGRTERKEGKRPATGGVGNDTHWVPAAWIGSPPRSEGSYTVTQSYEYKCPGCGNDWIPFAHYVITSTVFKGGDQWKHKLTKVGSGEQQGDNLELIEIIG